MTEYIREKRLLLSWEIDRIIASTPTEALTQSDFYRLGFSNWQNWLDHVCDPAVDELKKQLLLAILEIAQEQKEVEGSVEIEDDATLSESTDAGCYVQAWVWAEFSETPFDRDQGANK